MKSIAVYLILLFSVTSTAITLESETKFSENGKELFFKGDIRIQKPEILTGIVLNHPELRTVVVHWKPPRIKCTTEEQLIECEKILGLFIEGVDGWGSHIESLKITIGECSWGEWGCCLVPDCVNWLAKLCPRVQGLEYVIPIELVRKSKKIDKEHEVPVLHSDILPKYYLTDYNNSFPELVWLKLSGIGLDNVVLDQLLVGMKQLKTITVTRAHVDGWLQWLQNQEFIANLKKHTPNIEKIEVVDNGVMYNRTASNITHLFGISPQEDYFIDLNSLQSLRSLNLGTFYSCKGHHLSLLQLPQLENLTVHGLDSISLNDIRSILDHSVRCNALSFGGCRHISYIDKPDQKITELLHVPHYCTIQGFTGVVCSQIKHLKVSFVKGINSLTVRNFLKAFPSLELLEFQNSPEVSKELILAIKNAFPNLDVVVHEELPTGVIETFPYLPQDYD